MLSAGGSKPILMGFCFCLEEERKFGGRNPEGNRNEDNETEELTFILLPLLTSLTGRF